MNGLHCPICDVESDNRYITPECEHYEYSDEYDEYLPFVDCAGCGRHKLFNMRTSDAEGGQYFCSMSCLRKSRETAPSYSGTGDDMTDDDYDDDNPNDPYHMLCETCGSFPCHCDDTEILYSPLAGRSFTFRGDTLVAMGPKDDDTAPSFTIPCPDCGMPFDLRNDNFWNEVRDHTCTKTLPPMEYLQWEPDYKYDDETEESTFRAWHLFPDSWSAPKDVENAGCHACITPYHGRHTVRLERQGEFIADFLNIDTAKSYVERKITAGAWPMPKLY